MNAVRFEAVEKRFDGVAALRGLDLEAPAEKFLALLGPSGCGKTTALRILAGLEAPSGGRVHIGGRDVTRLQPRDRDVAMVFQSYALYPHMTVRQNISYPLWLRDAPQAEQSEKVASVAASLEIEHLLERRPRQLSGGQRQRVALARAIVRDPAAFLMDEPLSNLDARLRLAMRGEIKRLCHRLGATTIYVTHDQAEAMTMADLVAVMGAGELQQVASPQDIYDRPANRFVATFVGNPPMNILACSMDGGSLVVEGHRIPLSAEALAAIAGGEATEVGIRPEDVKIAEPAASAMTGGVYVVEPMGSETFVDVKIGASRVIARAEKGFQSAIGAAAGVSFDIADACFFNASGVTTVHRAHSKGGRKP